MGCSARTWRTAVFVAWSATRPRCGLAKALHPEVLFGFSTWLSGASRAATRDEAEGTEIKAGRYLDRLARTSPAWDLLVIGHVHHAFRITRGPYTLLSLGGWLTPLNYGRFNNGVFEQHRVRTRLEIDVQGELVAGLESLGRDVLVRVVEPHHAVGETGARRQSLRVVVHAVTAAQRELRHDLHLGAHVRLRVAVVGQGHVGGHHQVVAEGAALRLVGNAQGEHLGQVERLPG